MPRGAAPFSCLVLALLFLGAAAAYVYRRYSRLVVDGESMLPSLNPGDFLVLDQHAYRRASPQPGDVILLRDPRSPDRELLKRVTRVDSALGVWVEGDNPAASTDSRTFGWVPRGDVLGRVVLRYWPGCPVFYGRVRSASRASASSTSPSVGNASSGGSAGSK